MLHEIPRLGVEQHVLLLDAERVRVALAERVVEHARLLGAEPVAPLPVIDGGKICFTTAVSPLPPRSRRASAGRAARVTMPVVAGRAPRERLAVRAADVVDVRRVGDVDARAHDVVERRAGLARARAR